MIEEQRRSVLREVGERWLGRVGRLVRGMEAACALDAPLLRGLDRSWAAAVAITRFALLPSVVRSNLRVVADVGANRGDWSAALLRLSRPAVLYAFEPNPTVFELARARLQPQGAHCIQAAVGATSGSAKLHANSLSELSSLRVLGQRGRVIHSVEVEATTIDVPVVTLDEALAAEPEVSLIKLDVQGHERSVIAGARQVLARTSCLITEVLYERDYYEGAADCLELARTIEAESPLRLSCISEPALAPDRFGAWADAVFFHERFFGGDRP